MQSGSAIIAQRTDSGTSNDGTTDGGAAGNESTDGGTTNPRDMAEIRALADAAGYDVVGEVTQTRVEDLKYQFGRGKAETLAERVKTSDARNVIFDNPLSPQQTYELGELCPDGTQIIDRYRLVLEIFSQQAGTRRAKLQVELAQLQYELPRVQAEIRLEKEAANERRSRNGLGEKEDRQVTDIKDRIDRIKSKLESLSDVGDQRREKRREQGFDLVALAGYTNAGKSTLLRRLADEMAFDPDTHDDLHESAAAEDRLFKTLETTTRRAEIQGRRTLITDTVGFISDLPHWLVESFETTLTETYEADLVLLVADVSDPLPELREKLQTSLDLLDGDAERIGTVLNKADCVSAVELNERVSGVSDLVPNPVVVSTTENDGIDALRERIVDELPAWETDRLTLPNTSETMSLLSWLYDHARVEAVWYPSESEEVVVEFAADPAIAERATVKADTISA
ncbi:GTPase HflX [Haladaptatus cibarius]|uniref:GTPase HflX n=1 Tax=Haladaptatus cibarius TaxID=453847 RepID=UPI000A0426A0|nr:GTPase HflX [Haladaptatus cibarius]